MRKHVPYLNIFLSSPDDVADERAIARKIMKRLPNRPTFKGRVALNIIAWDDLDSSTAMEASLTPQAAINKGLPTPAESDIVIVIFWSRMGTPFTDEDGQEYQSGTHWELLNALSSKRTKTYIYRRMQKVSLDPDAEDRRNIMSAPETQWYRNQGATVDELVKHSPIVEIFFEDNSPQNTDS